MADPKNVDNGAQDTDQDQHNAGRAVEQVKESAHKLGKKAQEYTDEYREKIGHAASELSDKVRAKSDKALDKAQDALKEGREKAYEALEEGKEKASEALSDLSHLIEENAELIDEKAGERYGDYARSAARSIQNFAERVDEKDLSEIPEDVRGFVRKSPGVALGIAAAGGFLLSRLFRRRRNDV